MWQRMGICYAAFMEVLHLVICNGICKTCATFKHMQYLAYIRDVTYVCESCLEVGALHIPC